MIKLTYGDLTHLRELLRKSMLAKAELGQEVPEYEYKLLAKLKAAAEEAP